MGADYIDGVALTGWLPVDGFVTDKHDIGVYAVEQFEWNAAA